MIFPRLAIAAIVVIAVALLLVRLPGSLEAAPATGGQFPPATDRILVKFDTRASESAIQAR